MNISKRILAVDPGTRNIGIAFFDGTRLKHFGVKVIPKLESVSKELLEGRQIITELIDNFKPEMLVIERTYFKNNKSSFLLNRFFLELIKIGKKNQLRVIELPVTTVRKALCNNGYATKEEVAKILISKFSELKPYLIESPKWKERYYKNIFDAVALGVVIQDQL